MVDRSCRQSMARIQRAEGVTSPPDLTLRATSRSILRAAVRTSRPARAVQVVRRNHEGHNDQRLRELKGSAKPHRE